MLDSEISLISSAPPDDKGPIEYGYRFHGNSVFPSTPDPAVNCGGFGRHIPACATGGADVAEPLMERGRTVADYGRALAERVPYSLVALVSRFAVASVFWRSGQTKVHGFHIREETIDLFREEYKVPLLAPDLAAYVSTTAEHVFPVLLIVGIASRLSACGCYS